jgi:GntR family transcriptional regulator, carbon starvation induced regulator
MPPRTLVESTPKPAAKTLGSSLATRLRSGILDGDLAPGARLNLDELRTAHGVSFSPLREALSRLGAEGLVVMVDQRGYRVAPVSEDNLREVTQLRAEFEPFALAHSVRNGDDAWADALKSAASRLDHVEAAARRGRRIAEWRDAHRDYHRALIAACGMPLLLQFCGTLHDLADRYRRLFLTRARIYPDTAVEHRAILAAALARDAERAAELMRAHVERIGKAVAPIILKAAEAATAPSSEPTTTERRSTRGTGQRKRA